ncbi:uncharacterized protein F4817DRAFT_322418 [Daldinia loculata]|uniref:uncharacterized protein n=1 Tax=Daldinia loculata TaxID=103429 RepID=UPI0020C37274|nr:uncharacterized protein F4817DRAFT_322418 [Daldinia loculata]KAI1652175.1 hypothetical protein F4817DRAFT_322418 [Daldinia loculata]
MTFCGILPSSPRSGARLFMVPTFLFYFTTITITITITTTTTATTTTIINGNVVLANRGHFLRYLFVFLALLHIVLLSTPSPRSRSYIPWGSIPSFFSFFTCVCSCR